MVDVLRYPYPTALLEGEDPTYAALQNPLCIKMKAVLLRIHNAGFVHGDIARRNFHRMDRGDVFLVDFERDVNLLGTCLSWVMR